MRRSLAVVKQLVPTARVAQARTLITRRPLITPCAEVGCSSWAGRPRTFATAPPKDSSETTNNESTHANLGAEFMEEVELDDAEWEGEEVSEGVFISTSEVVVNAVEEGSAAAPTTKAAGAPRRPSKTSIKHLNRLLSRHQSPDIPESELEEKFVRGRGPGGQAINKTNSSVSLIHLPTGIRIQSQPTRSREQNRQIARQILRERLDLMRARGELGEVKAEDTTDMSRKERLAAEARSFSKQELRWEKERRRKLNKKKKAKKREKSKGEVDEAED